MYIFLYDEGTPEELDIEEIATYLGQKLGEVKTEVRGNPFTYHLPQNRIPDYAGKIARAKIADMYKRPPGPEPLYAEIEYERRRILGKTKAFGVVYDGLGLLKALAETLPIAESGRDFIHIILTNRLFATWDDSNKRYHLRTSLYAIPSVISTTGLVEAPARPKEYYLLKQQYERLGKDLSELKDKFQGGFLDYGDMRLTEVVKGYAMQAAFYALTGEPFCEDRGCRLYNAHWQEELIFAQLESSYEFCPKHTELLGKVQSLM